MYRLYSDEAWDEKKWWQSVSSLLLSEEDSMYLDKALPKLSWHELKFSRVRTNESYTQEVASCLSVFLESFFSYDMQLVVLVWSSHSSLYADMYEEIFLLSQSFVDGEFAFHPDQKNMMKRYDRSVALRQEYWISLVTQMDSSLSMIIQVMDIIAWLTIWLKTHYGTYWARKEIDDRYEKLKSFDRQLHMKCVVVDALLQWFERRWCSVWISEDWIWYVDNERVMVLEY